MDDLAPPHPALLPTGFRDLLPPEAETEAASVEALMGVFAAHGYERVKPPLLEFEDGFVRGSGAAVAEQSFRVMDPATHRSMVLRADMTPQVARIAGSRLAGSPRPLRLAYAGQCVRVRANGTDRQVPQAGIELIGADGAAADAEVMLVGVEALRGLGLSQLSLDLALPTLAPSLLDAGGFEGAARAALAHALDRKDAAAVRRLGGGLAPLLAELLLTAGPAGPALEALGRAALPGPARAVADRLGEIVALLEAAAPEVRLTVDPVEFRGFRYHTGVAVTVFAPGRPEELGRGGRYGSGEGEPATGLTLFADAVLRAAPARAGRPRCYVPFGTAPPVGAKLRAEGFATIAGLAAGDAAAEARRLGCSHVYDGSVALALSSAR